MLRNLAVRPQLVKGRDHKRLVAFRAQLPCRSDADRRTAARVACRRKSQRGCSAAPSRIYAACCATSSPPPKIPATSLRGYVTPRRLAIIAECVPLAQPDRPEERRGPRVGAPQPAIEGFLRSLGLAAIGECEIRNTGRGEFYFAVVTRTGRPAAEVLSGADTGGDGRVALAEIDALSGFLPTLGAAADLGPVPVRRRCTAVAARPDSGRPNDPRTPFFGA